MSETTTGPDARLLELGIDLGPAIPPLGSYAGVVVHDSLVWTSGIVGLRAPDWELLYPGRFGDDLSPEAAYASARSAMISTLANVRGALGSLADIERPLRVTGYIQSVEKPVGLPTLLNGATDLLADLFGQDCLPTRSAVGVRALPGNSSVELECVFALRRPA